MKKILLILLMFIAINGTVKAQTNDKSISELEQEKKEAIVNEDYDLAGELKIQIEEKKEALKTQNGKPLSELRAEKEQALKNEDYAKASELKKQIDSRIDFLNSELKKAVAHEDYDQAASIKKELNGDTETSNKEVSDTKIEEKSKPSKPKPANTTKSNSNEKKSIKEQLLTFEKKGVININYGLNNRVTGEFSEIEGIETSSFVLEFMYLNPRNTLSPVITMQYSSQSIVMGSEDMGGIFTPAAFNIDQDHFALGGGIGASTNFGLNKSKFKPFALITLGLNYYKVSQGGETADGSIAVPETSNSTMGVHINIRVGATYYLTNRLGIIFGAGLNNHTNLTLGLVF